MDQKALKTHPLSLHLLVKEPRSASSPTEGVNGTHTTRPLQCSIYIESVFQHESKLHDGRGAGVLLACRVLFEAWVFLFLWRNLCYVCVLNPFVSMLAMLFIEKMAEPNPMM